MDRRETRQIGHFLAADDDGRRYDVIEYQEFIEIEPVAQPVQTLKGQKSLRLDDGSPVNMINDDTFKVVTTDTIIHRIG